MFRFVAGWTLDNLKTPWNRLLRERSAILLNLQAWCKIAGATMGHVLAIMVALALYWALTKWLPPTVNIADLDSAIQLLIQVLAVPVAIMLVGVTVYAFPIPLSKLDSSCKRLRLRLWSTSSNAKMEGS
jgi:hypothetical protein